MAFLRFTVGSNVAKQESRSVIVACLLALVGLPIASPAASPLPPGSQPCLTNTVPAGYGTLTLLESISFSQTSDATPSESTNPAPALVAEISSPSAFTISNALLSNTRGFSLALAYQGGGQSSGTTNFTSEAALATALPAGVWNTSFQLVFTNTDSFVGFSVFNLSSNTAPVPQLANHTAAQSINPSAPFALDWLPWIGATTNDRISLVIVDASGSPILSASTDCSGQFNLPVGATGFTLPAARLAPSTTYTGYLTFGASRLSSRDDGALLAQHSFHSRTTRFTLRTSSSGGSGEPGTLSAPTATASSLIFTLTGIPGATYIVEASPDLLAWNEQTRVTLPASGSEQVTVPLPPANTTRFYRATSVGGGGIPGSAASLSITATSPTRLRLTITGVGGSTHIVESSTNFVAWSEVGTVAILEGSTNVVFTYLIPTGVPSSVFRTRSGDTTPPPTGKQPTLVATATPTGIQLAVTGGDPNRTYALLQANPSFTAWTATPFSITTGADGSGQTTVSPLTATSGFYRAEAR